MMREGVIRKFQASVRSAVPGKLLKTRTTLSRQTCTILSLRGARTSRTKQSSLSSTTQRASYDFNLFHYKRWWCQPPVILVSGVVLIAAANLFMEPGWDTTVMVGGPVLLWWYLSLHILPHQFETYAKEYVQSHPLQTESTSERTDAQSGSGSERSPSKTESKRSTR